VARLAPVLTEIVDRRRAFVEHLRGGDAAELEAQAAGGPPVRDFRAALQRNGVALIAECKARSPSAGVLQDPYEPVALACRYVAAGADAISVLTESDHFGGHHEDLRAVREAVEVPVLCKDFVIDEIQLTLARAMGADAVLLIVGILDDAALRRLQARARHLGLHAVVEVHTEAEVYRALGSGAAIIGINNRDLTRMETDAGTTARLRPHIPEDRVVISESGIATRSAIEALTRLKVDAALVGESLLRAPDLSALMKQLTGR
jgi:indole-3-glycerol phosphate synthase